MSAVRFGWGPFGHGNVASDADHLAAAREGVGEDGILLVVAGNVRDDICGYPVERKLVGESLVRDRIARDVDGMVRAPKPPGLGVEPDADVIWRFLVDVEIKVAGEVLYRTPEV